MTKVKGKGLPVQVNRKCYADKTADDEVLRKLAREAKLSYEVVDLENQFTTDDELGYLQGKEIDFIFVGELHLDLRTKDGQEVEIWFKRSR